MTDNPTTSAELAQVVQASNGLRSQIEMAKEARLPLDRIRIALDWLVARRCVMGSPQTPGALFRLTDSGNDMVKEANAAERQLRPQHRTRGNFS
jgi:hypothetical protein